MKKAFFLLIFLCSVVISAQGKGTLAGEILDAELHNEPLLFANILLKGTDKQTRTNFWGRFELTDIAPGDYILNVVFLGYESLELPVTVAADNTTQITGKLKALTITSKDIAQLNSNSDEIGQSSTVRLAVNNQ